MMGTLDALQAEYDAALPDYYENPGHDATPDYCALCEEDFTADDGPVETTWGAMHVSCADSHDEREFEAYAECLLDTQ